MNRQILPEGWAQPKGYANAVVAGGAGEQIFVGGQIGWNAQCKFETDDFVEQVRQALLNVRTVLEAAGAGPEHMVRMTWYLTDMRTYTANLRPLGRVYQEVMGRNYPAMSAFEVVRLVEERAQVEIEVTAVT